MVLASTSLQPIGVGSIDFPCGVPTQAAYQGQIRGNTTKRQLPHCAAETITMEADTPTIDRQSQVGISLYPDRAFFYARG